MQCHTEAAGRSLGLETKQLAFAITYPQTNRAANQLVTLNSINTLSPALAAPADEIPYPNPTGTPAHSANERVLICTPIARNAIVPAARRGNMDMRYSTPLASTNACDAVPGISDLGIANARLIAPGAADRSVPVRMSLRDDTSCRPSARRTRMPKAQLDPRLGQLAHQLQLRAVKTTSKRGRQQVFLKLIEPVTLGSS